MTRTLIPHLLGCSFLLFCMINTIVMVLFMFPFLVAKLLLNNTGWTIKISGIIRELASLWMVLNHTFLGMYPKTEWDIQIPENLSMSHSYLLVCNHQSWVDIFVLFKVFLRKVPFPMFFIKQKLIWIPFIGLAFWGLDFPSMKRYSKSYLKAHPEQRGKDLETTKKICEKFKNFPITMINFLEGTRYTPQKAKKQNTPHRHLLIPRAGGTALVLSTMGDFLTAGINVTIVYPKPNPTFWEFISGETRKVTVRAEFMDLPKEIIKGDYQNDPEYKEKFQFWVNEHWKKKDDQIEKIISSQ